MHIAQVAPLTEAIPPKLYGGTERVVSWLTEELIALGHEVTLFASGDLVTSARLEAAWPRALRLDGAVRDPNALHMMMLERVYRQRRRFRHPALSSRLLSVLAVLPAGDAVRHHAARPARPARAPAGVRHLFVGAGGLDLELAAAAAAAGALGAHRPSRPAGEASGAESRSSRLISPFSAASRRRRASTAPSASRSIAACRSRSPPRSTAPTAIIIDEKIKPLISRVECRVHRRDQRQGQIGFPERRDRAARSDRLARAVRPGDDRGHGLRHAGDRLQSRLGAGDHRGRPDRIHRRGRSTARSARSTGSDICRATRSGSGSRSASPRAAWRRIISSVYRSLSDSVAPHLRLVRRRRAGVVILIVIASAAASVRSWAPSR